MPVDFSLLPPQREIPEGVPSKPFWAVAFCVLTLLGALTVVLLWPKNEPAQTAWFWVCLTLYPAGTAALIVARRYSVHEGRCLDAQAWNEARERHIQGIFERASVPLAVLGTAYSYVDDEQFDRVDAITDGALTLKAQPSIATPGTVKARWFSPGALEPGKWSRGPDTVRQEQVLGWLIDRLLARLHVTLADLPGDLPLTVRLRVSASACETDVAALWRERWRYRGMRRSTVIVESGDLGAMSIDSWLDSEDAQIRGCATLAVVIQINDVLHKNPPEDSAEAGVALLLIHESLLAQSRMNPIAYVHRPMKGSRVTLDHVFSYALKWGNARPATVIRLWLSNVNTQDAAAVHASLHDLGVTSQRNDPPVELDIDRRVGHAGIASDWLAIACAASCSATCAAAGARRAEPQLLIMQRGSDFVSAVVASLAH